MTREVSSEEIGYVAADHAANVVVLMHRKVVRGLSQDEERELAIRLEELYDEWKLLDVLDESGERVPFGRDASGELKVDWSK